MRKPGTGRRRIEIKRIDDKDARMVTFSKRRTGLFRKAQSLADLFGLSLAIVVFSPGGRAFTCGDLSLVDRFLAQSQSAAGTGAGGASSSSAPTLTLEAKRQKGEGKEESEKELREYLRSLDALKREVEDRINVLASRSDEAEPIGAEDSAAEGKMLIRTFL